MSTGASRPKKRARRSSEPAKGEPRKPYPVWLVTTAAFVLPGSGQMLNGNPYRGITMQFFMLFLGFVTYQVTGPDISLIGRFAGGLFVYVMSVLDANGAAKRRTAAWQRMGDATAKKQDGPKPQPRRETQTPSKRKGSGATGRPARRQTNRPAKRDRVETEPPSQGGQEEPEPPGAPDDQSRDAAEGSANGLRREIRQT